MQNIIEASAGFLTFLTAIAAFVLLAGSGALVGDLSKDLVRSLASVIANRAARILPEDVRADLEEQWLSDLADLKDRSALFVLWTALGFIVAAFPLARAARAEARAALAAETQPARPLGKNSLIYLAWAKVLKTREAQQDPFSNLPEESRRVARALASFSATLASIVVASFSLMSEFASVISRLLLQSSRSERALIIAVSTLLCGILVGYAVPVLKAGLDEVFKLLASVF